MGRWLGLRGVKGSSPLWGSIQRHKPQASGHSGEVLPFKSRAVEGKRAGILSYAGSLSLPQVRTP